MGNQNYEVKVPDLGGAEDIEVIEIFVKPGDDISKDDALITLEGDKATMDVPAPKAGKVKALQVKEGDKVSQGTVILTLEEELSDNTKESEPAETKANSEKQQVPSSSSTVSESDSTEKREIKVPDIGGAENVDVIEILVKQGDTIAPEDPLITLEGDKATMDVPAPGGGEVLELKVSVGDKVSQGDVILILSSSHPTQEKIDKNEQPATKADEDKPQTKVHSEQQQSHAQEKQEEEFQFGTRVHAGPAVRRIAREFGVDLTKIKGSGEKARILKEDVQHFVKSQLQGATGHVGFTVPPAPHIDFSRFGEIETQPLSKIKKLTGVNMSRNWVTIPHVTQFGETDITALEAFRQQEKKTIEKEGVKLTPLVFIMKAVVSALKAYPHFNASLDEQGSALIVKKYFHVGVAVDTPKGLVVPVIRDVDKKSLKDLAKELGEISKKARDKGLTMAEMQGGCFTISSLGGIGGTAFTPIINAPEVSILGVSRTETKPVYIDGEFQPRLMLPLSLSYDHRVIDGADGARFLMHVCKRLGDIRTLLL